MIPIHKRLISQRSFRPALTASSLTLMTALSMCSFGVHAAGTAQTAATSSQTAQSQSMQTEVSSEFIFKYLAGEIAGQRGDLNLASNLFFDLAKSSRDPRLAERSAKIAVSANNPQVAMQAVSLWSDLDPDSVEAQQASTQMLVASGRLEDAKPYLQRLLAKEDTRANGFLYLNTLLARQQDKNAVFELVQELAKPYPKLAEAHFTLGHAAWASGKSELGLNELAIAETLHPGWEMNAILQGQILFSQSPEATLKFYREFVQKYPEASEVRLTMARLLVNQKRFAEAKPEFVKLVKASKNNPEILVVIGLLSFQAGEFTESESYFQQALKADFKDPDQIYLYLGQMAEKQKNDTQALAYYNKVQPGERYLEAKINIAGVIARTQNVDAAITMLNNLKEVNTEQMTLVSQAQANLLNQAKRYQDAYDLLNKAVNSYPNTPEIIYDFAMAAERVGQIEVSERELRKLIQIKPDFAQAYNALGYSLADRNLKLEEANKLIEKAHYLSPNDHYILDSMGWVKYRLGKLEQAADYLQRAYSTQSDPEIAAHLGEVLWQQGKREEALQTWEEALRAYPDNEVLINTSKKFKP